MRDSQRSAARVGSLFAAGIALLYPALGLVRWANGEAHGENLWQTFLQAPGPGRVLLGAIALLLLAVVHSVEGLFDRFRPWSRWLGQVATVGITAALLARVQDASVASLFYSLDPKGWLSTSCLVLWAAGLSLLIWKERVGPSWLPVAGLFWAAIYLAGMVAGMHWKPQVVEVCLHVLCFVLSPLWFGGLALRLRRLAAEA